MEKRDAEPSVFDGSFDL